MLVELYKDLCKNERWYKSYCETGENSNGKIFYFFNTNYRKLLSFEEGFNVLCGVENLERSTWEHNSNHGQEIQKQHTVNMLKSKLFSKNKNVYYRSKKGLAFSDMLAQDYTNNEKWIITYMTILNGYFNNIPNYIFKRVNKIMKLMEKRGVTKQQYLEILDNFISEYEKSNSNIFQSDYIIYDSFFQEFEGIDFLSEYINAEKEDKEALKLYIIGNSRSREVTRDNTDAISYKYKATGSYTKSTLIDNARIQYITLIISDTEYKNYKEFYEYLLVRFNKIYSDVDVGKVLTYIENNKSVYQLIYNEIFDKVQYSLNFRQDPEVEFEKVNLNERIDDTDINSIDRYNQVSSVLKKIAKSNSNYKCELEDLFDCKYFTSKESHRNYVEVHHFIPRAVGNDFESSIEIVENYVPLCPKCHRLLHLGEDNERLPALNYLLRKRGEALESKGLKITPKQMKEYYLMDI